MIDRIKHIFVKIRLFFVTLLIMVSMHTTANEYKITQESQLLDNQEIINTFWQTGEMSSFKDIDKQDIHYAIFSHKSHTQCIVISQGRSETYLKYKEMAYDLYANGYNVAMIDHRGQGLSHRELNDPHKGYVSDFNKYVKDMAYWIDEVVKPKCSDELFLLGHSMGSNIGILYMQQYPDTFSAAAFSAPMIAVNSGSIPEWVGRPLVSASHFGDTLINDESSYFFGHGPYENKVFEGNSLMSSKVRFNIFADLYNNTPSIQLGGVTLGWLNAAIKAEELIFQNITKLKTPILVLQAENDTVVSNERQDKFCAELNQLNKPLCPAGKPLVIKSALHELFFEVDVIRNKAIAESLRWFDKHSKQKA